MFGICDSSLSLSLSCFLEVVAELRGYLYMVLKAWVAVAGVACWYCVLRVSGMVMRGRKGARGWVAWLLGDIRDGVVKGGRPSEQHICRGENSERLSFY